MDYKLRADRGQTMIIRAISSPQEAFEEANRLIKEGYQSIEVRTPDGLVLLESDLSMLLEKKIKKPSRR